MDAEVKYIDRVDRIARSLWSENGWRLVAGYGGARIWHTRFVRA